MKKRLVNKRQSFIELCSQKRVNSMDGGEKSVQYNILLMGDGNEIVQFMI
jgi:hypothetical protein